MPRLPRGLALVVAFAIAAVTVVWTAYRPAAAQDATPPAGEASEAVPYLDADEQELALIEVTDVVDPFDDAPGAAEPGTGERFVRVAVAVENTGDDPLPLDPVTILLRDTAGFLYGLDADLQADLEDAAATPGADVDPDEAGLETGDLAPGDERTGAVGFAVDEEADLSEVLFVPETGRLLVLADLGDDGGLGDRDAADAAADEDEDATATPRATVTARADDDDDDDTTPTPTPTPTPAVAVVPTEAAPADTDGDGLNDDEEAALGTDPSTTDTDGDGLNDGDEADAGSNPFVSDSDEDGVGDAEEVLTVGTDATLADTDGDGLGDADEADAGTDPFTVDTDGDGATDGEEVVRGTDPVGTEAEATVEATAAVAATGTAAPAVAVDDPDGDLDGDGLTNAEETTLGTGLDAADSDGDGLPDGDEQAIYGTSPLSGDSDGDGVGDLTEVISPTPTAAP